MRVKWLALVVLTATLADAGARREPPPATFDNPQALDAFRDALAAQRAGTATHPLRISYFGDSLTADDHITDALRRKLQAELGDGGAGFVFAAPPHPYCEHLAVARTVSEGWHVEGISTAVPPDHLLGLGGSAECDAGGTIKLVPTGAVSTVELHYLAQPHGGAVDIAADGKVIATIATVASAKKSMFATTPLPPGTKHIELRARGRVRLFGAALEAAHGAVVDNLGVVNATAKSMHAHNLEDHWKNQLAHRASDLVVIMYGTNEAGWLAPKGYGMAEHEKLFGALLDTVRTALPDASCLVVSPLDQEDDAGVPREAVPAMVEAQRRAALAHGCAFWDTYGWMGGKGASTAWHKRGLMMNDFQHPTSEGSDVIAAALYAGLVAAK
jgi:lysophospholipase L1-like esterase